MDTLRSNDSHHRSLSEASDGAAAESPAPGETPGDTARDAPPPVIGNNERRMQVRAYNFWAGQLADHNFPSIKELRPDEVPDFGDNAVLLDFSAGSENPRIAFLGAQLAQECDVGTRQVETLADVPSRSLLSRITDHYMQILANEAPIGFEAEFVNQRGATILYRGILLPYSSDDRTIDYIYGVINWKELADQDAADELLLEIDQALEPAISRRRIDPAPLEDWADGPGSGFSRDIADAEFAEIGHPAGHRAAPADGGDEDFDAPAMDTLADRDMALDDWLSLAREQAESARDGEDRTRNALYLAIGRAWDFALAAAQAPQDFAELLAQSGLTVQERAPMTPIVKLVFGADYDKTRLTEYAAALAHAQRLDLGRGDLAGHLRSAEGGLKGVVAAERKLRRAESGKPPRETRTQPRKALVRRLRAVEARALDTLPSAGDEFALVMVRRTESGEVEMLGEVPGDVALLEKAARSLLD